MSAKRAWTVAEVAAEYLPADWVDGERWLRRRLNRGEIPGYRLNRGQWMMTDADVQAFITSRHNTPAPAAVEPATPPVSIIDGLSKRTRKSLRRSA